MKLLQVITLSNIALLKWNSIITQLSITLETKTFIETKVTAMELQGFNL